MCVIIHKKPGIVIDAVKIESACHVNSDGFGISFPDRGKLEIIREYDPKGNQPDRINKLLEELKAYELMLHLRFNTAGVSSVDNCHPFQTLSLLDGDDISISFMHNGTLSSFKINGDARSDSNIFNEEILRPLAIRIADYDGPTAVLKNDLFERILGDYAGHSIFTLIDSEGQHLIINKEKGYDYEGWWASNAYSFNRSHREPTYAAHTSHAKYTYYGSEEYDQEDTTLSTAYTSWKEDMKKADEADATKIHTFKKDTTTYHITDKSETETLIDTSIDEELKEQALEVTKVFEIDREANSPIPNPAIVKMLTEKRKTFAELAGLHNGLEEVTRLEYDDINELVLCCPDMATLLVMDLLLELYVKGKKKKAVKESQPIIVHKPLAASLKPFQDGVAELTGMQCASVVSSQVA